MFKRKFKRKIDELQMMHQEIVEEQLNIIRILNECFEILDEMRALNEEFEEGDE